MKVPPGGSSECFFLKPFAWHRASGGRRKFKSHRHAHARPRQKNGPPFVHILAGTSTPFPLTAVSPCHLPAEPAPGSCPTSRVRAGGPVIRGKSSRPNWAQTHRRADGPGARRGLSASPRPWHSLGRCSGQGSAAHFLWDIWAENPQNSNRTIHLNWNF